MCRSNVFSSRTLAAAVLVLVTAGAHRSTFSQEMSASPALPGELRAYVEQFTGAEPANCGQHSLLRPFETAGADDLRRAVTCALRSSRDRKPFVAFKQEQGIDSLVFQGLLGTSAGSIYQFSYDSAPCGGPGCAGRFVIARCERPSVTTRSGEPSADFGCRPPSD